MYLLMFIAAYGIKIPPVLQTTYVPKAICGSPAAVGSFLQCGGRHAGIHSKGLPFGSIDPFTPLQQRVFRGATLLFPSIDAYNRQPPAM